MRQIIDNFLPVAEFEKIQQVMTSNMFPWFLDAVLEEPYTILTGAINNWQLCHAFYKTPRQHTQSFDLIEPLLARIQPTPRLIIKIKANINPRTDSVQIHGYHTDIPYDDVTTISKTAVFYINDNDGYTIFENDKQIVSSVANRMLIFSANEKHSGTSCTDQQYRMVINFNYI